MSTTTAYFDRLRTNLQGAAGAWEEAVRFWEDTARKWTEPPPARDCGCGGTARDCGCGGTDCCQDACTCRVPDADVVLHTRVGEARVVAFRLRNTWRRPREVVLAVGDWQVCQGEAVAVDTAFDVGQRLTLEPCADRVVRLLVGLRGDGATKDQAGTGRPERLPDVGTCTSLYADIRFEGCARPQRIAVVIHPAGCVATDVTCDCGCC